MSEQDRFDWSDDTDFESLADEPIEGFGDFEDAEAYSDFAEDFPADSPSVTAQSAGHPEAPAAADRPFTSASKAKGRGRPGVSGSGLGFLVGASTLVAAAGIGSVGLMAVGANPVALWQPETLLTWPNYLDPIANPLNLLALVTLGVVMLTLLGSGAIARASRRAAQRARNAEEMLDLVTALRLENESAWQDPAFKEHGNASAFVAETLGAWRLQAARQRQYTGLEGELRRLQKAVADRSRQDLSGRFDTPAVGTLADEVVRHFDEMEALVRENANLRTRHQSQAEDMMQVVQEARCWQDAAARTLGLQGTATERLAERLNDWAATLAASEENGTAETACEAFKTELNGLCEVQETGPDATAELTALVDKGSKLAFQIAMEVARLGPRGERLVPMSQSLEDLTTDFRQVADQMRNQHGPGRSLAGRLHKLTSRFAEVQTRVSAGGMGEALAQVRQLGPAAGQLARNLGQLVHSHGPQAARLSGLGSGLSELSGVEFDADNLAAGGPENVPSGVISLADQTPFRDEDMQSGSASIHQPAEVDPFSVTPPRRLSDTPGDPSFTGSVTEPSADIFGSRLGGQALPRLEIESSFDERANPFASTQEEADKPHLSAATEKVYDLEDFDATPAAADEEPIHDLTEFGAVPQVDVAVEADEEPIYDLSSFAAEPIAAAEPETGEPVYDLAELGGIALESPLESDGEPVFDLDSFGAVPVPDEMSEATEPVFDLNAFGAVPLT